MNTYEAIKTRGNIRTFRDEEVPRDKLLRALDTGLLASSAMNEQPWEFIMVTDQDKVSELARYKYEHNMQGLLACNMPHEEADKMASVQRDAFRHTVPVVVIYKNDKRCPVESSWSCITTIWLALVEEGLAMSPAFFAVHAQDHLKEILSIPEGYDTAAILRIGVPAVDSPGKQRKTLDECLYYNEFGQIQDS